MSKYKVGDKIQVCLTENNSSIIYWGSPGATQIKNNKKIIVEIVAIGKNRYFILILDSKIDSWNISKAPNDFPKEDLNKKYPNGNFWFIDEKSILGKVKESCNICKKIS